FAQRGASGSPRATAFPWSDRACCSCSFEWHVPHFTGAGLSCGKSFPSRSAWQPVHPKLPCTEVENFFPSTYSETVLPARVVLMLFSPWHARHSAPGWSAARTGHSGNRREKTVARSVATIILRPAHHFLRTTLVSAMSNFRQCLLHAKIRKHFRVFLLHRQQVVARTAIIGDGPAIGAGMTAVMAAEAARRIIVPNVIRVSAPGQTHVREDVAQVDLRHLVTRLLHHRAPRLIDLRVIRPIEIDDFASDVLLCHIAGRIIHLENLDRLFPDEGKLRADLPERHLLVHCAFGHVEGMRGPVVAIHGIHHAMLSFVQLLLGWLRITGNEFGGL